MPLYVIVHCGLSIGLWQAILFLLCGIFLSDKKKAPILGAIV